MHKGISIVKKKNEKVCNITYNSQFDSESKNIIEKYIYQILNKINYCRNIIVNYNEKRMITFSNNEKVPIVSIYLSEIKSIF